MSDEWIGRNELASMLGVSERTLVRRLEKAGLNTSEYHVNSPGQPAVVSPEVLELWNVQDPLADAQLQREVELYAASNEGLRIELDQERSARKVESLEKDLLAARLEIERLVSENEQLRSTGASMARALYDIE